MSSYTQKKSFHDVDWEFEDRPLQKSWLNATAAATGGSKIGENEKNTYSSFKERKEEKPQYDPKNYCPQDIKHKYQWAELKSSLLIKYLVHDDSVQKELVEWLHDLVENNFLGHTEVSLPSSL